MSVTYSLNKAVTVIRDAEIDKTIYVLHEETRSSSSHPSIARWSSVFAGSEAECLKYIVRSSAGCAGGDLQSEDGALTELQHIGAWRQAFANPYPWPKDKNIELKFLQETSLERVWDSKAKDEVIWMLLGCGVELPENVDGSASLVLDLRAKGVISALEFYAGLADSPRGQGRPPLSHILGLDKPVGTVDRELAPPVRAKPGGEIRLPECQMVRMPRQVPGSIPSANSFFVVAGGDGAALIRSGRTLTNQFIWDDVADAESKDPGCAEALIDRYRAMLADPLMPCLSPADELVYSVGTGEQAIEYASYLVEDLGREPRGPDSNELRVSIAELYASNGALPTAMVLGSHSDVKMRVDVAEVPADTESREEGEEAAPGHRPAGG